MTDLLFYGDTERSYAMRHELPLSIGDPFLLGIIGGRLHIMVSPLESSRIEEVAPDAVYHDLADLGFQELRESGLKMHQLDLELVSRAAAAMGVANPGVDPEEGFQFSLGHGVGLAVHEDPALRGKPGQFEHLARDRVQLTAGDPGPTAPRGRWRSGEWTRPQPIRPDALLSYHPAMASRDAACSCGQLRLTTEGDPFVVSICQCLSCQRRTGSAFGMQAGFRADQVQVAGRYVDYARTSDERDRKVHVFHFCPDCGGTVFSTEPDEADLVVVMVGAFGIRRSRRRPNRATGRDGISGSTCPRASPATRCGHRFSHSTRRASTRRLWTAGERCSRNIPSIAPCCTTSPAARAWPVGRAMPSSICEPRSTSTTSSARWPPRIPTSTRSATSLQRWGIWSAARHDQEDIMSDYTVARIDDIDELSDGRCPFRPVRKHFGIMSFGVNTWTGKSAGDRIINEHDEADEHEELYLVQQGRATFELDGERVDAPAGTMVFARPGVKRTAFAEDAGTTIVAIGGTPGQVYDPSGFEIWLPLNPLYEAGEYAEAADRGRGLIEENPEVSGLLYNVACCESLAGRTADAIDHLRRAIERSERFRSFAAGDSDFDPIREEPAFKELMG